MANAPRFNFPCRKESGDRSNAVFAEQEKPANIRGMKQRSAWGECSQKSSDSHLIVLRSADCWVCPKCQREICLSGLQRFPSNSHWPTDQHLELLERFLACSTNSCLPRVQAGIALVRAPSWLVWNSCSPNGNCRQPPDMQLSARGPVMTATVHGL